MNIGEEEDPIELPIPIDPRKVITEPMREPSPAVTPAAPVEQPAEPVKQSIGIRLVSGEITPSEAQAELVKAIVDARS